MQKFLLLLYKRSFHHRCFPAILKILRLLTGNLCGGACFQNIVVGGTMDNVNCYKGALLETFFWDFSETFETAFK